MSPLPVISVVTVVLNNVEHIQRTVESVIGQSYPKIEYIVIDGGSKDGTVDILNKFTEYISILISEPDKGLYDAMNKGTNLATGEWIIYMNSGDRLYDSTVLSRIFIDNYHKIMDTSFIYTDAIAELKYSSKRITPRNIRWTWIRNLAVHQSTIVKTSLAKEKRFNLKYEIAADYDFVRYAYTHGAKFLYLDDVCLSICNAYEGVSKTANPFKILWQASVISIKYAKIHQIIIIILVNIITLFYALLIVRFRRLFNKI